MKTVLFGLMACCVATQAFAEDVSAEWKLEGTNFNPPILIVEAKSTFTLKFSNANPAPAELECKGLKIEKPVVAGGSILVRVLNPKPGVYDCVDEPHEDVAKGQIEIK